MKRGVFIIRQLLGLSVLVFWFHIMLNTGMDNEHYFIKPILGLLLMIVPMLAIRYMFYTVEKTNWYQKRSEAFTELEIEALEQGEKALV